MISIITPTYNGEKHLADTIASVLEQSCSAWELIVVDDGSADSSSEIAARFSAADTRVRLVRQNNQGIAAARNRGLAECSAASTHVLFLDHDDVLERDALAVLLDAASRSEDAIGAHGVATLIGPTGETLRDGDAFASYLSRRRAISGSRIVDLPLNHPTTFSTLMTKCWIHSAGLALLKKDRVVRAGGFDRDCCPADDWDLWLRLTWDGPLTFVPAVTLKYRMHGNNTSHRANSGMRRAEQYVWRKAFAAAESCPERARLLATGYRLSHLSQAQEKALGACRAMGHGAWRSGTYEFLRSGRRLVDAIRGAPSC